MPESLYERLGGTYAIAGAVDVLVDRLFQNAGVVANPAVAEHHVAANGPGYKFLVTAWSIEACGGPKCYPGDDMIAAHTALHISDEQFNAVFWEIEATLRFVGVPEDMTKEFMDIIEHYRPEVVQQQKVEQAGTLAPAG